MMLSIASNSLSGFSSAGATSTAASMLATQTAGDAGAAARQFTQNAVTAAAAPAAYFPGTAPSRDAQNLDKAQARVSVPPPTGDYVVIDQPPPPPQPAPRVSTPVTLGIPLTTQLTAQMMAQQTRAAASQPSAEAAQEKPQPVVTRKETSFATARGARAYNFAAQRSAEIIRQPEPEAV
jgi:hypothetical protein